MSKLPLELRVQVARKTASDFWEINGILEIIRKELEAREISESVCNDELRRPNETWKQNRQQDHNFSAASLFVKDGKHERKIKCVCCGQNLYSASCQRVKDNEETKSILRDQKRCCLCLQTGHSVHECENGRNCRWCNGKHRQSICSKNTRSHAAKVPEDTPKEDVKDDKSKTQDRTTTTTSNASPTKVLLQTATTHA